VGGGRGVAVKTAVVGDWGEQERRRVRRKKYDVIRKMAV
jgi:hypothetical protein